MEKYCGNCGTQLIDGVCPNCVQANNRVKQSTQGNFSNLFMSPKERMVVTLGNSYLQNFLQNGGLKKGFAVVSDKRIYFHGKSYDINYEKNGKRKLIKNEQTKVVDLKDVTGTGTDGCIDIKWLIYIVVYLVLTIILLFLLIAAVAESGSGWEIIVLYFVFPLVCVYNYMKSKMTLITVEYAGGKIGFDKSWFTQREVDEFQKLVHIAKDKATEESDNAMAVKLQQAFVSTNAQPDAAQSSVVEELVKLGDLLEKGMISRDEFERLKREMI